MKTQNHSNPAFPSWPALLAAFCVCVTASLPVQAQNVCATQASLVNPALASGLGGTGAPATASGLGGTGAPAMALGVGGTGAPALASGVGGTGAPALDPGGIGGTGMMAGKPVFGEGGMGGTGIVGVITGFASICVNGIEVHYDANTPVWDNGKPGNLRQLAVGQVVAVTANEDGAQPTARGISMIDALVGPVGAIDAATGQMQVLGQKVTAQSADVATLKPGDWVRVSGFQTANGDIAASRVLAMPAQAADASVQVRGPVTEIRGNTVRVGQTSIDMGRAGLPAGLAPGQELWASGVWRGGVVQSRQTAAEPTRSGLGRVNQVVLEGYVHTVAGRAISLGYGSLQLNRDVQVVGGTEADIAVNRRVQVRGRVGADQRITVERVELSRSAGRGRGDAERGRREGSKKESGDDDGSGKSSGSGGSGNSGSDDKSGSSNSGSGNSGSSDDKSGSGNSGSASSGSGGSGSGSSGSSGSGSGSSGSSGSGSGSSGNSGSGSSSGSGGSGGSGSSGGGGSGSGKSSGGGSSGGSGKK